MLSNTPSTKRVIKTTCIIRIVDWRDEFDKEKYLRDHIKKCESYIKFSKIKRWNIWSKGYLDLV
jgi:hypothetical protein